MDNKGVINSRTMPYKGFDDLWDSIIIPKGVKNRLLSQVLLEFTVRGRLSRAAVPLHGVILLVGPPGTGKTSLAKALASKAASLLQGRTVSFLEVEPHALTGSALGKSQRAVRELLQGTVAERAAAGPLIVLLDEVETLAADRSKMSLEANPIDVHRATDAVLASLDQLTQDYPELLFLATSNFEGAIDEAFLSRADLIERIDKPDQEACEAIMRDTLAEMSQAWPRIERLANGNGSLEKLAHKAVGMDGRQLRKAVLSACTFDKETAMDPGRLSLEDLHRAIAQAKEVRA